MRLKPKYQNNNLTVPSWCESLSKFREPLFLAHHHHHHHYQESAYFAMMSAKDAALCREEWVFLIEWYQHEGRRPECWYHEIRKTHSSRHCAASLHEFRKVCWLFDNTLFACCLLKNPIYYSVQQQGLGNSNK